MITKGEIPQHQLAAVYEPMIGFTVFGRKTISFGESTVKAEGPSYYVIPTQVPATGKVDQAENGQAYLSLGLKINKQLLRSLLEDNSRRIQRSEDSQAIFATRATEEFVSAWVRLLRLLETPEDIPALASVYEREILYRILIGPQGQRLKLASFETGPQSQIHRAIQWIRENYWRTLDVRQIAEKSGMAWTTFHRQFKRVTGLSPIQYQKELRLLEARKILVHQGLSVREAAFQVGYESASQFNREYSRHFGSSPAKDAHLIRVESKL
nr:AraC family transcriptional regulator [Pseudobdellovibrio exovorus]